MQDLTVRIRVAAYVLRRRSGRPAELLVFDHDGDLLPGTHVPEGGGPPGDSRKEAVRRDGAGGGGRAGVGDLPSVAAAPPPPPTRGSPRHTTFFQLAVDGDA